MAKEDLDTSFAGAIEAGNINGAIICATDAQGRFVYNNTIGERTLLSGEKIPHRLDDVLFLGSATKLLATIAALTCVDDGSLSLTGDLSQIAPELASKKVLLGVSEQDEPILEPASRPITLEMLLTHSSGLTYHFLDTKIGKWRQRYAAQAQEQDSPTRMTVEELISYPLSFQPGEGWMYGTGLDWAGRIVERVTGKTLLDHLKERAFSPLGFDDAQFYPVTREDLRARMVDLNPNDPEALGKAVLGGSGEMNKITKGDFGGHGLFMTAQGYIKILRSLLANDGKVLKSSTVDLMFEHHLGPMAAESHMKACESPLGRFFRVGTEPGSQVGHGLGGLLTLQDVEGWYGEHTLTWGGGLTFTWFVDRKNDLCGLCAIQATLPVDGEVVSELKQTFRHGIYREREKWKIQDKR